MSKRVLRKSIASLLVVLMSIFMAMPIFAYSKLAKCSTSQKIIKAKNRIELGLIPTNGMQKDVITSCNVYFDFAANAEDYDLNGQAFKVVHKETINVNSNLVVKYEKYGRGDGEYISNKLDVYSCADCFVESVDVEVKVEKDRVNGGNTFTINATVYGKAAASNWYSSMFSNGSIYLIILGIAAAAIAVVVVVKKRKK